jgi:hypothetical protein
MRRWSPDWAVRRQSAGACRVSEERKAAAAAPSPKEPSRVADSTRT